ncbi:hypothetical protein B0I37DRAFT_152393 [Chaetomium sp. MPI-CAGE-AT-0009]|nr:hypothetical protein B0I37DRAFT_152393 [Chaetomium sp. MPI-CAGE-AT-0009]
MAEKFRAVKAPCRNCRDIRRTRGVHDLLRAIHSVHRHASSPPSFPHGALTSIVTARPSPSPTPGKPTRTKQEGVEPPRQGGSSPASGFRSAEERAGRGETRRCQVSGDPGRPGPPGMEAHPGPVRARVGRAPSGSERNPLRSRSLLDQYSVRRSYPDGCGGVRRVQTDRGTGGSANRLLAGSGESAQLPAPCCFRCRTGRGFAPVAFVSGARYRWTLSNAETNPRRILLGVSAWGRSFASCAAD